MSESTTHGWGIEGTGDVANALRAASRFVPATAPVTVLIDTDADVPEAFALGTAAIRTSSERVVPLESAFEAVEAVRAAVKSGDTGLIYGCFTSIRLPRGSSPAAVMNDALLPALALTLDTIPGEPQRVWAKRVSLFNKDDAWFVTIRMRDETLLTIEAMASERPGAARSILVELTSSERVLRAEPARQAVVIERLEGPSQKAPWWEDLSERYLHLVQQRSGQPDDGAGTRLRAVWDAVAASEPTGNPVVLA